MFCREFMIRAYDRPFEKRPHAFNCVAVDIAINPFLCTMINGFMACILISYSSIRRPIICIYSLCIRLSAILYKLVKGLLG
jgi:hypothetical protein